MQALHKNNTLMDDRKLEDFIAYMQQYSKNLLFINTYAGHPDFKESWEHFFKNDILFLIANVATKKPDEIKEAYDSLFENFERNKTSENFSELVVFTFSSFKKINTWYALSSPDHVIKQEFALYIRSYLKKELENIREMLSYIFNQEEHRKKIESFRNDLLKMDPIWGMQDKEDITLRERIFAGDNEQEKLIRASLILNKTFDVVFHAIESIVKKSQDYFEEAIHLTQIQNHHPHVALIVAFLKLYDYIKEDLNKVPQRLLNFYYRDVLRIKEKDAIPDKTFVVFELVKGFDVCEIKKGTKLSAGKDKQNRELIYETEKDVVINKAQVNSLHTIFIERNGTQEILNYYKNTIDQKGVQVSVTSNKIRELPKIFGERKTEAISEIGFAIASSQFYLAKGERNVVIIFESAGKIEQCNTSGETKRIEVFDKGLIKLLLTGEKGWINSDSTDSEIRIESLRRPNDTRIELNFIISIKQDQAIIAFDKKVHEGNFNTSFPVLQCILKYPSDAKSSDSQISNKWKDQIDQLCILQKLQVASIEVRVQVGNLQSKISFDGVKDLILENHETILDSKKPFYPFTPVPKVGSSFYIGCKDLFYKNVKNLSVNIEWLLPDNFRSYYQKYLPPYDTNKFIASLSLLNGKQWKKISEISVIDVNTADPKFRVIKINNIDKLKQSEASIQPEDGIITYDNTKKNGTLRLKLDYLDFGHSIYPQLITSAVMERAAAKSAGIDFYKIVKRQLHDSVISIKLPEDVNQRSGSLKVIYDILERVPDNIQAKTMIINALSDIIRKYNGENMIARRSDQANEPGVDDDAGRRIVNDENFREWMLRMLKKIKLVNKDVHADRDLEDADDVADEIKETLDKKVDFIMPSDKELINLIMNETNTAINKTVINVVDEILTQRVQGIPEPAVIADLLRKEFGEANDVINDMIAKKISILLSANEIPLPPYTPLINNISISYSAEKELSAEDDDKLFHITPLGIIETDLLNANKQSDNKSVSGIKYIFPHQFINTARLEWQGMLFIGIKDLFLNQNLSLLIQVAEGTKMNDKKPPVVNWFCSSYNDWLELKDDNIISDGTYGLQTTGIIEFSIPNSANNKNTLFNTESLYWLCATVDQNTDAFPSLIDVKSQTVIVTFRDYLNNPMHMALPLEAGKIKDLVDEITQVKKVSQPVSSFNGKIGEKEQEYYTRVSERLRHKSRAICNWDYERLVLEEFPSFYKVKCLNNYRDGHFAVGHVTIVPIADLRNKNYSGSGILIPKTNYIDLRNIENFLYSRSSPFVKIHAINPQLEYVLIQCKVKLYTGVDKGFYLQKLNDDLINFLTPWVTGDADAISFSSKIYSSSIINFIDRQDYVNYVIDLVMQQYTEKDNGEKVFVTNPSQLTSLVETDLTTEHSILVSAPKHEIELVE